MKKSLAISALFFSTLFFSQEKSIEKSIFNVQTGLAGIWANNELQLVDNLALRSEIGLTAGFWGGSHYEKTGFLLSPLVRLEPRYYYNIERRISKGKNIDNNSANFFSLKSTYYPDWFVVSNYSNLKAISGFSIVPTYGFRRSFSSDFHYEFSFGLGYRHLNLKKIGYRENQSGLMPDLTLRVGYSF